MSPLTDALIEEYQTIITELPNDPSTDQITTALVRTGDWTTQGAETILHLARTYGTFVLRNALALANALDIEDGDRGL